MKGTCSHCNFMQPQKGAHFTVHRLCFCQSEKFYWRKGACWRIGCSSKSYVKSHYAPKFYKWGSYVRKTHQEIFDGQMAAHLANTLKSACCLFCDRWSLYPFAVAESYSVCEHSFKGQNTWTVNQSTFSRFNVLEYFYISMPWMIIAKASHVCKIDPSQRSIELYLNCTQTY